MYATTHVGLADQTWFLNHPGYETCDIQSTWINMQQSWKCDTNPARVRLRVNTYVSRCRLLHSCMAIIIQQTDVCSRIKSGDQSSPPLSLDWNHLELHSFHTFPSTSCNAVLCVLCVQVCWLVVWNMNFIFPYVGNVIIPTDELHDFSEG